MTYCNSFEKFDPYSVPSPCFVVDEIAVERNLKVLARVREESGAKVLIALKAFSMFNLAPLIMRYLDGCCASGLYEAKLAHEEFSGEVHTFSAAYKASDLEQILKISNHVIFNSFSQWKRFEAQVKSAQQQRPELQVGLRINPMHSEGAKAIYDPCAPGSRLGIVPSEFEGQDLSAFTGLHFHTLCEQGFGPLSRTLDVVEETFADILPNLKWVNFGGGHHISKPDYDVAGLIKRIREFQDKYQVQVYLEPGEAIAIHTGVLVSEVLDLGHNSMDLAIMDSSATCHMPDTLEMPYRADILKSGEKGEKNFTYRLGGLSCLAGDVMGDYSFDEALAVGQRLMFDDMSHYTMVKTNTFNGVALPSIAVWNSETDVVKVVRSFDYSDFKTRLS